MVQICASTAKHPELSAKVSGIVDRINSVFATLVYQPVVLLNQDISNPQYLALLAVADSLLITSLREGMNLISHEFVYSQNGIIPGSKNNGVLILSEFTGSSSIFKGFDLPVNPWNYRQCADAINKALAMKPEERERRWKGMHECVLRQDARTWYTRFVKKLKRISLEQENQAVCPISHPNHSPCECEVPEKGPPVMDWAQLGKLGVLASGAPQWGQLAQLGAKMKLYID